MRFKDFLTESKSQFFTTREEIESWLHTQGIRKYTINNDLTVDVPDITDHVVISEDLKYFPVKFGKVRGNFIFEGCKDLVSLEGVPDYVGGGFWADGCTSLKSLKGCPIFVGGTFDISGATSLASLDSLPRTIGWAVRCKSAPVKNYLRLLQVKDLKELACDDDKLRKIITMYLPEGDIFACQQELMDAGLEEYAEL